MGYAQRVNLSDWVTEQRRRKFMWAGRVCRMTDGRWTRKDFEWQPTGVKSGGRPVMRWVDAINHFFAKR
eukprot:4102113-Karenia_brevis.AAC.1